MRVIRGALVNSLRLCPALNAIFVMHFAALNMVVPQPTSDDYYAAMLDLRRKQHKVPSIYQEDMLQ